MLTNLNLPERMRHGAVAIGNFDGVHLGHARIVAKAIERAQAVGGPATIFTFDPHPVRILRPEAAPPPLTWTNRKTELLGKLGVGLVLNYPTDEELLQLSPSEFFDRIVREQLDAKAIVEGPNFYFGRNRAGTIDVLRQLCHAASMSLDVVEPLVLDGDVVSSSRVRRLVADGQVEQARRLLTEPYRIRGVVVHGARRGKKLGFGTANLEAIETLLPAPGVYAGRGFTRESDAEGDTRRWPAAINIGPSPTFGEHARKVEVHLIGWPGRPLYEEPLEVDFLARLRNIERFDGVEALQHQLQRDVQAAQTIFRDFETLDKLA